MCYTLTLSCIRKHVTTKQPTYQLFRPLNGQVCPNNRFLAEVYQRLTFPALSTVDKHSPNTIWMVYNEVDSGARYDHQCYINTQKQTQIHIIFHFVEYSLVVWQQSNKQGNRIWVRHFFIFFFFAAFCLFVCLVLTKKKNPSLFHHQFHAITCQLLCSSATSI